MIRNPWTPMLLGLAVEVIAFVTLLFLPETLPGGYTNASILPTPSTSGSSQAITSTSAAIPSGHHSPSPAQRSLEFLGRAHSSLAFLVSDSCILLIVSAFIVHMLFLNRNVMLQYISTQYAVSIAQATVLISIRSGLVFLLCIIILPVISLSVRGRLGAKRADLVLSQVSAALLALGFLGVGLAPNLPVLVTGLLTNALGWGLFPFLRSLSTGLVEPHHVARLNSCIGVFDTAGLMVGSPLLAALFTKGIEVGGVWFGLPFLVCAAVVTVLGLILARVRV
ncbi:hypothetical protein B0T22DRAFT_244719 [Podospora appendiculata]|uniref:Major facilitator superfamily (MFS) profile domain-containing protein n=1 Tax=Podospora appendiculata TaxID=314037 RepID=A0AAE1C8P9_9PEZI|nr:hypothetical protein B0T22DRAFT_244719 [Podospora appendiculata]